MPRAEVYTRRKKKFIAAITRMKKKSKDSDFLPANQNKIESQANHHLHPDVASTADSNTEGHGTMNSMRRSSPSPGSAPGMSRRLSTSEQQVSHLNAHRQTEELFLSNKLSLSRCHWCWILRLMFHRMEQWSLCYLEQRTTTRDFNYCTYYFCDQSTKSHYIEKKTLWAFERKAILSP